MSNKDLLKQAIAEAKTIREAAIANAKEALEESLTPHLKEMLAQKLQEMEEDEHEFGTHIDGSPLEDPKKNMTLEEEESTEEEEPTEEEGNEEETEEEDVDVKDMSVEELKDLIRDIVSQEVGEGESEEEIPGEEAPEGEDLTGMDSEEEEIDINELLRELEEGDTEKENLDENVDIIYELIQMFPFLNNSTAAMLAGAFGAAGLTGIAAISAKIHSMAEKGTFGEVGKKFAAKLSKAGTTAGSVTQQKESMAVHGDAEKENLNENVDIIYELINMFPFLNNQTAAMLAGAFGAAGLTGIAAISAKIHSMAEKGSFGEVGKKFAAKLSKAGTTAGSVTQQKESMAAQEDLNEALKTIKVLRSQLQEVNLLNAKLLYVNKVFKANNLTEGQKVNVVAAFDRAETVKEVKLVFETVSKNVVTKPATIKEHKSFASKAAGTSQTAGRQEIISEVSDTVKRMQKLAGIIK